MIVLKFQRIWTLGPKIMSFIYLQVNSSHDSVKCINIIYDHKNQHYYINTQVLTWILRLELALAYSQNINSLLVFYVSGCICNSAVSSFVAQLHAFSKTILSIYSSIQHFWHKEQFLKSGADSSDIRVFLDILSEKSLQLLDRLCICNWHTFIFILILVWIFCQ